MTTYYDEEKLQAERIFQLAKDIGQQMEGWLSFPSRLNRRGEPVNEGGKEFIDFVFQLAEEEARQAAFQRLSEAGDWENLAHLQLETLRRCGYAKFADSFLFDCFHAVAPKAKKYAQNIPGHIPFLVVVPEKHTSLHLQVQMVQWHGRPAEHEGISFGAIKNVGGVQTPEELYLAVDVDVGFEMSELSSDEAYAKIRDAGRLTLVAEEGIALMTHLPRCLRSSNQKIIMAGSTLYRGHLLAWSIGGFPTFDAQFSNTLPDWGKSGGRSNWVVSCSKRIEV